MVTATFMGQNIDALFSNRYRIISNQIREKFNKNDIDVEQQVRLFLDEIGRLEQAGALSPKNAAELKQKVYKHALRNQIKKTITVFQDFQTKLHAFHESLSQVPCDDRDEAREYFNNPQLPLNTGKIFLERRAGVPQELDLEIDRIQKLAFGNLDLEVLFQPGSFKERIDQIQQLIPDKKSKIKLNQLQKEAGKVDVLLYEEEFSENIQNGVDVTNAMKTVSNLCGPLFRKGPLSKKYRALSDEWNQIVGREFSKENQGKAEGILKRFEEIELQINQLRDAHHILQKMEGLDILGWGMDVDYKHFLIAFEGDLADCRRFLAFCKEERRLEEQVQAYRSSPSPVVVAADEEEALPPLRSASERQPSALASAPVERSRAEHAQRVRDLVARREAIVAAKNQKPVEKKSRFQRVRDFFSRLGFSIRSFFVGLFSRRAAPVA